MLDRGLIIYDVIYMLEAFKTILDKIFLKTRLLIKYKNTTVFLFIANYIACCANKGEKRLNHSHISCLNYSPIQGLINIPTYVRSHLHTFSPLDMDYHFLDMQPWFSRFRKLLSNPVE